MTKPNITLISRLPPAVQLVARSIIHRYGRYHRVSYSQEGEDIVLERFFGRTQTQGFYVDVGANHPSRCSNTYFFYKKGWRGINIDAAPGSMRLFDATRPRDLNLEVPISDIPGTVTLHMFGDSLLSSMDNTVTNARAQSLGETACALVQARRLDSVLAENMPAGVRIDFMSIDVEGYDLRVLRSNDWSRFRPRYVLVEILGQTLASLPSTETFSFLTELGYVAVSKLVHTVIFRDKELGPIEYV